MSLLENAKREQVEVPVHIPTLDGKAIAETIMVKVAGIRDAKTGELFLDGEHSNYWTKPKPATWDCFCRRRSRHCDNASI